MVRAGPAQVGQQPARDEDLALVLGQVVRQRELPVVLDLGADPLGALGQLLLEVRQRPPLPYLGAVVVGSSAKVSATIPCAIRLRRWMRANDLAITALTPSCSGASAACSRDEPWP